MVAEALKPTGPSSSLAVRENFVRRRDFVGAQVHILLVCADNKERYTLTARLKRLEYAERSTTYCAKSKSDPCNCAVRQHG